jgi:hypothetical protein
VNRNDRDVPLPSNISRRSLNAASVQPVHNNSNIASQSVDHTASAATSEQADHTTIAATSEQANSRTASSERSTEASPQDHGLIAVQQVDTNSRQQQLDDPLSEKPATSCSDKRHQPRDSNVRQNLQCDPPSVQLQRVNLHSETHSIPRRPGSRDNERPANCV